MNRVFVRNVQNGPEVTAPYAGHTELHILIVSLLDDFTFVIITRSRDRSQMVTPGIYSVAADISVCLGVDSASKNEYQDIPGGKGGRCVRVTTLPPSCAECLVIWSLNRPEPSGPHRPVIGVALHLSEFLQRSNWLYPSW